MTYGLSDTGFNPARLEDLKTDLDADFKAAFGDINTSPESFFGILIAEFAKPLADLWEQQEAIYKSQYPSTAEGMSLDDVADYVGIKRLSATSSTVTAVASGTEGTVLTVFRLVGFTTSAEQFASTQSITITKDDAVELDISVATVQDSTLYTITINGETHDYTSDATATATEIIAGLKTALDASTQPITAVDNGDDTLTITSTNVDTPFVSFVTANLQIDQVGTPLPLQAVNTGPIAGPIGTLTKIVTPVSGWSSVTNWEDAALGRNVETDVELRLRRAESLQVSGSGTVESIRARLREVTGVTDAYVIENRDELPDVDGRPGHSFESVVAGGADQDIADTIWAHKPVSIETYGTEAVNVTDSQGTTQTINFSRATEIYLWVKITVTLYSEESYPTDGDAQIAAAALAYGNTLSIGNDVIPQRFIGPTFGIPGIATVLVEIATSAAPGGPPGAYQTTNLAIDQTEQAIFDSSRITVVSP